MKTFIFTLCLCAAAISTFAQNCAGFNATANNSGILTCYNNTATLTATATGGIAPYSYEWSGTNCQAANCVVTTVGIYTVTVTDAQGCTMTTSTVITQDLTPPNVTISPSYDSLTCTVNSIPLTASGGISYTWSSQSSNINGNTAVAYSIGTYTVTASTVNGCTASAQTIIMQSITIPVFQINPVNNYDIDCANTPVIVVATGAANLVYAWSNGQTGVDSISITTAGNYYVTATNPTTGCTAYLVFHVIAGVPIFPFVNGGTIHINNPMQGGNSTGTICAGQPLIVTGGGNLATYTWSSGTTGTNFQPTQAGVYTVSITNPSGCQGTTSVTVTAVLSCNMQASVTITQQPTCNNWGAVTANAIGGTPPYIYTWSNGFSTPNNTVNQGGGTYTITITDANGYTATTSYSLNIDEIFIAPQNTNITTCHGVGSSTLDITGTHPPFSVLWDDGSTNITRNNMPEGYYMVTVTNAIGCSQPSQVYIPQTNSSVLSPSHIYPNIYPDNCQAQPSGSINIYTAATNIQYNWSNGSTTNTITDVPSGWYSVTISQAGCDTLHRNCFIPTDCQATVSGYVLYDNNSNCMRDTTDIANNNGYIQLHNTHTLQYYYAYANTNGYYQVMVDMGSYQITHYLNNNGGCNANLSCSTATGINLMATQPTNYTDNNFYYQPVGTPAYNLYTYAYNQTARPVFPRQFDLIYYNAGNTNANNTVLTFTHDSLWANTTMLNNAPMPTSSTATTKTWNLGTVAPAYNNYHTISFTMELPATTPIGIPLYYTLNINADGIDCYTSDNTTQWSQITTNSLDPNDKTLLNPQDAQGNILNDGAPLTYQIRFQNTGTDTAYSVTVRDTIDLSRLSKTSFKVIASSYPNMLTHWEHNNILVFEMPHINLVDSFRNEPASHGWLQYSINPLANTPLYSTVNNTAAIIFDYNTAVVTNTVHTTFVPHLSTNNVAAAKYNMTVTPNPATTQLTIHTDLTNYTLTITDLLGQLIYTKANISTTNTTINISDLPSGAYFIHTQNDKGRISQKFIKQ
jgi:hypothetical protein